MKKIGLPIVAVLFLFSCSAPKYTYHFSTHKTYTKKDAAKSDLNETLTASEVAVAEVEATSPADEQALTASVQSAPSVEVKANPLNEKALLLKEKYSNADFSKAEVMREVKADVKELKKDIKKYVKESKKEDSTKDSFSSLDKNLRLAIIFAIAAAITSIFLWQVGAVLWVIALVFLLLWVLEQ